MRRGVIGLILTLAFPSLLWAGSLRLGWNANAAEEKVSGYKIHLAYSSGNYYGVIDVGNVTQAIVTDLDFSRRNIFAVSAYRNCVTGSKCGESDCASGQKCESALSTELSVNPKPQTVTNGKIIYAQIGMPPIPGNMLSITDSTFADGNHWNLVGADLLIQNGVLTSKGLNKNQAAILGVSGFVNGKSYTVGYEVKSYSSGSLYISQWGFVGVNHSIILDSSVGIHEKEVICIDSTKPLIFVFNNWSGGLDNITLNLK